MLEKARFGDRLDVTLRIAPEVMPVTVPFLCVQPLVENAVRHGLEGKTGVGHVSVRAEDVGAECVISVEDDGVGIDPEKVRRTLTGRAGGDHVGLANVDERMRLAFGDRYGLVVETARGRRHQGRPEDPEVRCRSGPDMTLRILAVDDERPALDELVFLLSRDPRVGTVQTASDGAGALRLLQETAVDAVFLDIRMPGLTGLDLARVLGRFRQAPVVVFVSAYDDHAVDAFEVKAVDYVMKPVRETRLREAVRRVIEARRSVAAPEAEQAPDETIPVELGGVTRFIQRSEIRYAEAQGDYARLHTSEGSHLVRVPLSTLEERWTPEGFVRIHRSHLVAVAHIVESAYRERTVHGRGRRR